MRRLNDSACGFSLMDLLATMTLITIVSGMAVPLVKSTTDQIKLGQAAREVERELQTARLKAVSANQPMRMRFNCPAIGDYRMVELVGTPKLPAAADDAADRCGMGTYPYPAPDNNALTRPNHDGPVRYLDPSVSFGTVTTIEFWPDGTSHTNTGGVNPWPAIAGTGTTLTLTRSGSTKSILVNGVGKIQLLP